MMRINLANVIETTGINLRDSANFDEFNTLLQSIVLYDQWTYDFSMNILTIDIPEGVEIGDLSVIGGVIE